MVTEGYIRSPPLPRTTSARFRPTTDPRLYCNLQCILRVVFKNTVFYRVSGPSAAQTCTLAMLKNVGFSIVFALRGGKNRKKLSLKGSGTENWPS